MSDALVILREVEYLGWVAFDSLIGMDVQGVCSVCGRKTVLHLISTEKSFHDSGEIYSCCDRQCCYDASVRQMQEDYYLFVRCDKQSCYDDVVQQMQEDYYLFVCCALNLLEEKNGNIAEENVIDSIERGAEYSMLQQGL